MKPLPCSQKLRVMIGLLFLIFPSALILVAQSGQGRANAERANSQAPAASVPSKNTAESQQVVADKVDDLNRRLDSELKASDDRYEALLRTTERDFHAVELVVVLGSLFVGIVVGWATYREVQQRAHERTFYEGQVTKASEREEQTHSYAIRFAEQHVSRSAEILSEQIENMSKLGKVIDMMNKTFEKQLTTMNQVDQLKDEITKLQGMWTNVAGDYEKKYNTVDDIMAPFKDRNRMDVSRLSSEEATEPNRALAVFLELPEWFLVDK
jgi:hypothetical protein